MITLHSRCLDDDRALCPIDLHLTQGQLFFPIGDTDADVAALEPIATDGTEGAQAGVCDGPTAAERERERERRRVRNGVAAIRIAQSKR